MVQDARRPLINWEGDEATAFEDQANNVLNVDDDDLRNADKLPEITWNIPPAVLLGEEP